MKPAQFNLTRILTATTQCLGHTHALCCMVLVAVWPATAAVAQSNPCGSLAASYGPHDFRTDRDKLPIVTGAHFTPEVEQLIRGITNRLPGGDIAYTLRAIPNHPNALVAMTRLGDKEKTLQPSGSNYTVECWYERAIRFRTDDQVVRMLYAKFLISKTREPDALAQLQTVKTLAKDNPFTHYNLGLLFFELKKYEESLAAAHRAYELGFLQPELRDKLQAAGQWRESTGPIVEPVPPAVSDAASK